MDLYTAEELYTDLSLIDGFTLEQCNEFKQRYFNKRKPECLKIVRDKVEQRKSHLERIERKKATRAKIVKREFEQFERRIDCMYSRLLGARHRDRKYYSKEEIKKRIPLHARSLGSDIFDIPYTWLGLSSVDVMNQPNPKKDYVVEHFWPRSIISGIDIVTITLESNKEFTIEMLIEMLYMFNQIVRTTARENNVLHQYHKINPFINPQKSYDDCGIQLVRTINFEVPALWEAIFDKYNLDLPDPYSFKEMTIDQAITRELIPLRNY